MTQVINKPIVYLDLDGVLVNMVAGTMKALGVTDYKIPPGEYSIEKWEGVNVTTKQFWNKVDQTNEHFWANLEKYEWADELVELCQSYGSLFFLTSPSRNPYCLAGKLQWIQKHYKKLQRKIILTPHKYLCAAPNRVLIDDSDDKIEDFIAYGGQGILFPQLWNKNYDFAAKDLNKIAYVRNELTFIKDEPTN